MRSLRATTLPAVRDTMRGDIRRRLASVTDYDDPDSVAARALWAQERSGLDRAALWWVAPDMTTLLSLIHI